jgi:hypothetical protein
VIELDTSPSRRVRGFLEGKSLEPEGGWVFGGRVARGFRAPNWSRQCELLSAVSEPSQSAPDCMSRYRSTRVGPPQPAQSVRKQDAAVVGAVSAVS